MESKTITGYPARFQNAARTGYPAGIFVGLKPLSTIRIVDNKNIQSTILFQEILVKAVGFHWVLPDSTVNGGILSKTRTGYLAGFPVSSHWILEMAGLKKNKSGPRYPAGQISDSTLKVCQLGLA